MRFLLQQCYGMNAHALEYLRTEDHSGIILSPRACKKAPMQKLARSIRALNRAVLMDPQFYEPRTDHPSILSHDYWNGVEFQTQDFDAIDFCKRIVQYALD